MKHEWSLNLSYVTSEADDVALATLNMELPA